MHRSSGNISGTKEGLNIPNEDIVCSVWSVVHNKLMEINQNYNFHSKMEYWWTNENDWVLRACEKGASLFESQLTTINPAGLHTPKLSTLVNSIDRCRNSQRSWSDLVYDLCIRDKDSTENPLLFVDRDGFRYFIQKISSHIDIQSVRLANEWNWSVSAAYDKWTKKRCSFLGSTLYWVSRPK